MMRLTPLSTANFRLFLIMLGLLASLVSAPAFTQNFVEGKDYIRIVPPVPTDVETGKVEVREFFWYGCMHCYSIEPDIQKWAKPDSVQFVRTPALLGKNWVTHAYTYYTLEQLKRIDDLHAVLFEALHEKKLRLFNAEQLADFFAQYEIGKEKFLEVFHSMVVDAKIKRAEKIGTRYALRAVPTFTVNGKYLTSPSMMTGGAMDDFFQLIDHLVSLETRSSPTSDGIGKN